MLQYEPKAPYVRNRDSAFTVMMDVVIALLPLYFMAFYFYGLRALMLGLASVAAAVVSDFVCILLEGKKPYFRDISSVVTGMMLPLMMSAATPYGGFRFCVCRCLCEACIRRCGTKLL